MDDLVIQNVSRPTFGNLRRSAARQSSLSEQQSGSFGVEAMTNFARSRWGWALPILMALVPGMAAASDIEALIDRRGSTFRSTDCWFELAPDRIDDRRYSCGEFAVPEHWDKPSSRVIHLPVVTFHATDADPDADPVVFLNGGPGARSYIRDAEAIDLYWLPFLQHQPWTARRDFIVVGLRGTNWTDANLGCPDSVDPLILGASSEAGKANRSDVLYPKAVVACLEGLAEDHDFSGYNVDQSARDIATLRIAMSVDRWTLLGISYGTRLALQIMRDYPDGIGGVVLDSVTPIDSDQIGMLPANLDQTLKRIFQACRYDATCNRLFPDSEEKLKRVLARAAKEELEVAIEDHPVYGTVFIPLTPSNIVDVLLRQTYSELGVSLIPFLVDALDRGYQEEFVSGVVALSLDLFDGMAMGAYYIQTCNDSLHDLVQADRQDVSDSHLIPRDLFSRWLDIEIALCRRFAMDPLPPDHHQGTISDVPTLLLSGYYDAATPPRDAIHVARSLPRSYQFTFPDRSHSVLTASLFDVEDLPGCPSRIVTAFLDDPEERPDDSCLQHSRKPNFLWDDDPAFFEAEVLQRRLPKLENRLTDNWSGVRSDRNATKVAVVFRNQTLEVVTVYWIDFEGQRKSYGDIDSGGQKRLHTFKGHRWELESETGKLLGRFVATTMDSTAEVRSKNN